MAGGEHLILYDGVCGLCNRLVRFVLARDVEGRFDFAALQGAAGRSWLARFGKDGDDLDTVCVVVRYRTGEPRLLTKARAALFVAIALGAPWSWLRPLGAMPDGLLDQAYDLIARNRYRIFGRYERCPLPAPEERTRFIDG